MRNAPVGVLSRDLGVTAVHRIATRKANEVDVQSRRGAADHVRPIADQAEAYWPVARVADEHCLAVAEQCQVGTTALVAQLGVARQQRPAARVQAAKLRARQRRLRTGRHLTQSSRSVSLTPLA